MSSTSNKAAFQPRNWKLLVAGEWNDAPERDEIRSPWDSSLAGTVPRANAEMLERATRAAEEAFAVTSKLPRWRRSQLCRAISERIAQRADEIAELITRESGKPIQYARAEVTRAATTFAIAAEEANRVGGEVVPLDILPGNEGSAGIALRFPIGPVAAIAPFNFPINLVAHKLAPALAAGCPVVLKPAPQSPLTALLLAEIVLEADAPPAAFQVLHMDVPLAEPMARDDRFALLSFTGSAKVGWHLKSICGRKKIVLELGGNAAAIVHRDADLEWAVQRSVLGSYAAAGQVCIKAQRLLVHEVIYDDFRARFIAAAKALRVGDPLLQDTVVGPLIDERAAERVMQWIDEARVASGRVLCGARREKNVVHPTLLEGAADTCRVVSEEVFGPVSVIEKYSEWDLALARANCGPYGLQAGIFTNDINLIRRAVEELKVGGVIVNDAPMFRVDNYPYGGVKASGLGREGVRYAIEDMTEQKMVVLRWRS